MDSAVTNQHHQLKKNVPQLKAGDRVRVHQKIQEGGKTRVQVFEGLVIKTQHGRGINGSFTVRRISLGVGVEKTFPLHSPSITKIEKLKSAKVRRAKLYYVRGLVGKAARRLTKEKEDAAVWEDVVEEKIEKDPEQEKIEKEAEEEDKAISQLSVEKEKAGTNPDAQKAPVEKETPKLAEEQEPKAEKPEGKKKD